MKSDKGFQYYFSWTSSRAARISVRGRGNILGGRPRGRSEGGAPPPRTPENFENFKKISQENGKKWIILAYSQQDFKNPALIFRAFGRKIQIVGKF